MGGELDTFGTCGVGRKPPTDFVEILQDQDTTIRGANRVDR
jgi:hypothetical protein